MENELFEKVPVHKAYFKFALPVVFSMVISLVYNMVDTYFIAQTNNTDLIAGVSLGAPIFTLMIALGDIFGLGGSSVISRLFGQKKDNDGKRLSVVCFYYSLVLGIFVTIIMLLFRSSILNLLGADNHTLTYASQYYTYIVLGAPFIILALTPSNLLRTEGLANASMIGTVLGAVVNIILDPIFISLLKMGAGGAAIATVIGNICSNIFFIWILLYRSKKLSINFRLFHISFEEMKEIFSIGIPASITNLMQSLGIAITNLFLLSYGNDKIAAMGIVMKVNLIAVLILVGFSFGAQPLIGYNYGAKNFKRLKETLRFSYIFECSLALIVSIILSIAAPFMMSIFIDNAEMINTGSLMLRLQLISMVFIAVIMITTCTFQAAGKATGAFILSISRQGIVFLIVIFTASKLAGYNGVIASQAIADLITAAIAGVLFYKNLYKELNKER